MTFQQYTHLGTCSFNSNEIWEQVEKFLSSRDNIEDPLDDLGTVAQQLEQVNGFLLYH